MLSPASPTILWATVVHRMACSAQRSSCARASAIGSASIFAVRSRECFADILRVGHSDAGKVGAAGQEIEDELMTSFGDAGEILGELRRIGDADLCMFRNRHN